MLKIKLQIIRSEKKPKVSLMALEVTSKEYILNYYTTRIYADELGDMVVVRNPTLTEAPTKSEYEPKSPENDGSIKKEAIYHSYVSNIFIISTGYDKFDIFNKLY